MSEGTFTKNEKIGGPFEDKWEILGRIYIGRDYRERRGSNMSTNEVGDTTVLS